MKNPDEDIQGLRVRTENGTFGTVVGRDIFGARWQVRLDTDAIDALPSIYDPSELVEARLRVA